MSSRATRILRAQAVRPFAWTDAADDPFEPDAADLLATPTPSGPRAVSPPAEPDPVDDRARMAAIERDAFATAYAQGEKAGLEAGAKRGDAMLRRLSESLTQLDELRTAMISHTERQVVQLALEIARRILRHEVQADHDLLCAMARVALDRIGDASPATVRLNPEDYHTITARHGGAWAGNHVTVVADPAIGRGGCMVESSLGFVDAGVESQFRVLEQALLSDDVFARVDHAA